MPNRNIVTVIQCRTASHRLPGKAFLDLGGAPLIARVIERCQLVAHAGQIVIATTTDRSDDILCEYVTGLGVSVFRGSTDNVLGRIIEASEGCDFVIRATADNPLVCPLLFSDVVSHLMSDSDLDYVSCSGYPLGVAVQGFKRKFLQRIDSKIKEGSVREHVFIQELIKNYGIKFRQHEIINDLASDKVKSFTVDTLSDYLSLKRIESRFGNSLYEKYGDELYRL